MNAETPIQVAAEDLYYGVHKGIRLANARMLVRLGSLDPADEAAVTETLAALEAHLGMSLSHLAHENHEIHTALERRCPGATDDAGDDHDHHEESFVELRRMAGDVALGGAERPARLRRLYQRFALFVADDLAHMHEEETRLMPLIEANFTPAEIVGIRERIVGSIEPTMMLRFMSAMLAAASATERREMVEGMQAGMPPEVFAGTMTALAGGAWVPGDWAALDRALAPAV